MASQATVWAGSCGGFGVVDAAVRWDVVVGLSGGATIPVPFVAGGRALTRPAMYTVGPAPAQVPGTALGGLWGRQPSAIPDGLR
ncbi:MAG: hypothetical protein ACRDRU_18080 [Pseudonocardiaceae bacterium]